MLPPGNSYLEEGGIRFLRATELGERNQINWDSCLRAPQEFARHGRAQVRQGDVLLAAKGATIASEKSVCLVYQLKEPTIINGSIFRFQPTPETISPFLLEVLSSSFMRKQMKGALILNNAVDYLSRTIIDDLLFPLPPLPVQRKMVAEMEFARESQRSKLEQADALLSGLDAFLLERLGLTPPPTDIRLIYGARLKDINRHRLDAHFYRPFLRKTESAIRGLGFQIVDLGSLLREPPLNGLDAREFSDEGRRYIRVQNIRPFDLSFDDVKYVTVETEKDVSLAAGDVLLTRKGTFGVAAVVPPDATDCLISSEVILLRLRRDSSISEDFLVAWINSTVCQTLLSRYKSGGIMGHLTQDVVEAIPVPVADKAVQDDITAEVARRRMDARRLREEAAREWEASKARFEARLLGSEAAQ